MGGNNVIPEKTRMAPSKIAITIDERILKQIDMLVKSKYFPNRSKAIFFRE
jgi:metal-responsive CopG/Arc/MetJ family transcriptional regulator